MASGRASVRVHELAKSYGSTAAVRGVSFEVAEGEIFGLLGRNGAGKTTTLECLLGLRTPDAGKVTVSGIDVLAEPERARHFMGAQLQGGALQDKMTARQALRFFASFYRHALPVETMIMEFALGAKADATFHTLSAGQKQRLFLALAFLHQPRVVILDEPTAGLDPQARRELHEIIRRRREAGVSVLLSTHYIEEAAQLCDRVGILHEGRIVAVGAPGELVRRARARSSLSVRTARPLAPADILPLGGIAAVNVTPAETVIDCTDVNQALVGLARHAAATANALVELRIRQPTLEDAFIELTGSAWPEETS